MQLQLSTWREVEAYLERSRGIVIPIGSSEQHGPTGLIGTDAICPEVIARHAAEQAGMMVGPTFNVGIAQHHMAFPGTMTIRPSTMIAAIFDWVSSLARHGFERFYFLNGHGGNIPTINAAFSEIYTRTSLVPPDATGREHRPVRCTVRSWWMLPSVIKLRGELFGDADGRHATPSEIAVTQFAYPDEIKQAELEPKRAPIADYTDALHYQQQFPDGRIGSDPSLASPAYGERLVECAAKDVIEAYEKFVAS